MSKSRIIISKKNLNNMKKNKNKIKTWKKLKIKLQVVCKNN